MEDIRIKPENIDRYKEFKQKLDTAENQIKYINRELTDFKGQPVSVQLINGRGYFISQKSEEILKIILEELIRERTDLIAEMNSL